MGWWMVECVRAPCSRCTRARSPCRVSSTCTNRPASVLRAHISVSPTQISTTKYPPWFLNIHHRISTIHHLPFEVAQKRYHYPSANNITLSNPPTNDIALFNALVNSISLSNPSTNDIALSNLSANDIASIHLGLRNRASKTIRRARGDEDDERHEVVMVVCMCVVAIVIGCHTLVCHLFFLVLFCVKDGWLASLQK